MTYSKFKLAHFNPKELEELDSWQGGRTDAGKDLRHLSGVEELLSDPRNEKKIMKVYETHAKGGRIGDLLRDADRMRHKGRNGDSEMALIGPNTERVFNRLMHGGSVNPMTKRPEYFNLGGFLGGIGKTLSRGARKIMPGITNALPGIIQGGMMGGPEGALAGGAASLLGGGGGGQAPSSLGEMGQQFMESPMAQKMGGSRFGQMAQNMGNKAQQMYGKGQQMYGNAQKFMQSPTGQAMMNSPYGQRAQKAANPYMQRGQNAYNQAQSTAQGMGGQMQGMYNQADQGYQNMMNQGNQYNQQANNRYQGQQNNQGNNGSYDGDYDDSQEWDIG